MTLSQSGYRLLSLSGWPARRRRSRAAIFCFHNVVEQAVTDADHSLHLPVDRFTQLIEWISETYQVIQLEELLQRADRAQPIGGLAALTIDDAYVGFLRLGLPLLEARGLPATLFVVSGAADAPRPFWWDLAGANHRLDDRTRALALTRYAGRGDAVAAGLELAPQAIAADLLPAPWKMLAARAGPTLTMGCHTASHPNLTAIRPDEVTEEFAISSAMIAERLGIVPTTVSYPYGLATPAVHARAKAAGFRFGLVLGSEPVTIGVNPLAVPRINLPATVTIEKLACWATGLRWNKPR